MHIVWKTLQIYKYKYDFDLFLHICWCCGVFFGFFFSLLFSLLLFYFFICVCFLRLFLCAYVCVDFLCRWVGFLTGGGCVIPCSCTKDKNSIKQIVACVVCYSGSKYGTYFLITRVYCGFMP